MAPRKLIVFKHESELGNAPAQKLFDLVTVKKKDELGDKPARSFADYSIEVATPPTGVEMIEML
jgi:CRISPR-associated protein Csd2